jgi:deoxyribonuclease-4
MSLIGIHVGQLDQSSHIAKISDKPYDSIGLFQIFVNPLKDYNDDEFKSIRKLIEKNNIRLVVHASYVINISKRWKPYDWWVEQLITEIKIAEQLKCIGVVIHTGKKMELNNAEALNNMYTLLLHVHRETNRFPEPNIPILIETPSGQGTEQLTDIDELCRFLNKFYHNSDNTISERFGICIDTCHIFAAGYDVVDEKILNSYFSKIDKLIGLNRIKLCHINDSKGGLGSHLDRHQNIGYGFIGRDPIKRIISFMNKLEIPMILETPSDRILDDLLILRCLGTC